MSVQNSPLAQASAVMKYGVSQIPVVGGLLSTILSLFWPSDNDNVWDTIKDEVLDLIDEEIDDEEWSILSDKLNEIQDKVTHFNSELISGNYDLAKSELMSLVVDLDGVQDNFKISGKSFEYAFAPLFVAIVNLKIFLYLEGLKSASNLGLTSDQILDVKGYLKNDVTDAKSYLQPISDALSGTDLSSIENYVKRVLYYRSSVELFNSLWSDNYEGYVSNNQLENYYIPVVAAGEFYKLINLDGQTYAAPMAFYDVVQKSMMPSSNINGALYQPPEENPEGYLNYIDVYTDLSTTHRTTGLSFKCDGSETQYNMGMTPDNNISFNVGQNELTLSEGEYINEVTIYAERFVSKILFKTNNGNTFTAGQNTDSDNTYDVKLVSPFTVNSMYVPSDFAGNLNSSGHQMTGIAVSAIYNNKLALEYVSSLYKG